jgi:hypothetical protein
MAGLGKIYNIDVQEPQSGTVPLLNPKRWAGIFLLIGVIVSAVFGMTMVGFFKAAFKM